MKATSSGQNPWSTEPNSCLEPRMMGAEGSGIANEPPVTIIDRFKEVVKVHGTKSALFQQKREDEMDVADHTKGKYAWKIWTWQQYHDDCCKFAKALIHLKVEPFGTINILGSNSPQWLIASNGATYASCIPAGIYATDFAPACHYITQHSRAQIVVLDGEQQLKKYCNVATCALPDLKSIVVYGCEKLSAEVVEKCSFPVYFWSDFLTLWEKEVTDTELQDRIAMPTPGNCSTVIYTSGTTGPPKAVMISHDNITWITKNFVDNILKSGSPEDRMISFLPLSHIAAQFVDMNIPLYTGAQLFFFLPEALKGAGLTEALREVKPTIFLAVPRVWEKIMESMLQAKRTWGSLKKNLSAWAARVGMEHSRTLEYGASPSGWFSAAINAASYPLAKAGVFSPIHKRLGLEHCRYAASAAATLPLEVAEFFASLDIQIMEVFGQSECSGPHTASCTGQWRLGYVGRPLPGTESKLDPDTHELCYRGRHIFMGYMNMPEQTAETIDCDGWLRSGDMAEFDGNDHLLVPPPSGFMKITGRIKELIITAGGENVPPAHIEAEMKSHMKAISNCFVIGNERKYLTMLIALRTEIDPETAIPSPKLSFETLSVAKSIGSSATTVEEVAADPLWAKYFDEGMAAGNKKATSNAQVVQKWNLLPCDFSEATRELTPTQKLKRKVVNDKYADLIDGMYSEGSETKDP